MVEVNRLDLKIKFNGTYLCIKEDCENEVTAHSEFCKDCLEELLEELTD